MWDFLIGFGAGSLLGYCGALVVVWHHDKQVEAAFLRHANRDGLGGAKLRLDGVAHRVKPEVKLISTRRHAMH